MRSFAPTSLDSYLALARSWAATVTVVTALRADDLPASDAPALDGFTATAFLTVSMSPPIVAVSATSSSSSFAMIRDCRGFAVNLLAVGQQEIAASFARTAAERPGIWQRIRWVPDADGVPLLEGATGGFSARVRQLLDAGDHTLILGDVTAIHLGERGEPLIYHNRSYGRVVPAGE